MIRTLLAKAAKDALWLLAPLFALVLVFEVVYVWVGSSIKLDAFAPVLRFAMPKAFDKILGMPLEALATRTGSIAMSYLDPIPLFSVLAFAVARGSDAVSGELGRGTMEMLLAQPVRRAWLLFSQAAVTTAGIALLSLATLLGIGLAIQLVTLEEPVALSRFAPAALNLFALGFFLAGLSTLVSSWESYRWRTIGVVGMIYAVSLILKIVGRSADLHWMRYATFLSAFEPHLLALTPDTAWAVSLRYDGFLIGGGVVAYLLAGWIFARRDLPAPV